jgi:tRNA threonylcarbamoyladenosine biosynthesis protein TsaE
LALTTLEITTGSPLETQKLGEVIGRLACTGDIILLTGPLGAGKTCLTQGIARGLGIRESTPSPTFMLAREYHGRLPLYHVDLYRLEFEEISDLGLDEYLFGEGIAVVEWAEKDPEIMAGEHLLVELAYAGESERRLRFYPHGGRYSRLIDELRCHSSSKGKT